MQFDKAVLRSVLQQQPVLDVGVEQHLDADVQYLYSVLGGGARQLHSRETSSPGCPSSSESSSSSESTKSKATKAATRRTELSFRRYMEGNA